MRTTPEWLRPTTNQDDRSSAIVPTSKVTMVSPSGVAALPPKMVGNAPDGVLLLLGVEVSNGHDPLISSFTDAGCVVREYTAR